MRIITNNGRAAASATCSHRFCQLAIPTHEKGCRPSFENRTAAPDSLLEHLPLASTVGAASTMGHYCRSSFEEGLGAFGLAVEMDGPGRPKGAAVVYERLRRHYGLDERTLEFWSIHIEAEEEHGENAVAVLERVGQTAEQQALIRRAFRLSVIAHAGMTDGFGRLVVDAAA